MEESETQAIIALSFGQGSDGRSGLSNEALARIVSELSRKYGLPVVAQWEIADCIPGVFKNGRNLVIREHRQTGQYLDSYEVLAQAKIHCDNFSLRKVIIVAHPDHAPRCAALALKLGFVIAVADTQNVPYDPNSTQEWTRDQKKFLEHEKLAMEYYRQKGYL